MEISSINPSAIHGEAIAGRAATVRKELSRMVASMAISTFDVIALLVEVQENSYASQWGFTSVIEYGQKELKLKKRKIQYLARIGRVAKAVGLTRSQYERAGVTKLREITTLNPEGTYWNKEEKVSEPLADHIVRLILDSDELTVEQVKEEVLRLQGRTGPDRPVTRSYTVPQSVEDKVIKVAVEKARMLLGSAKRDAEGNAEDYSVGVCLEVICATFNADPNNEPDTGDLTTEEVLSVPTLPMEKNT